MQSNPLRAPDFRAAETRARLRRYAPAMVYRRMGSTGLEVSAIGLGTWQLGGEWGRSFQPAEVRAIFEAARQHGITLVDTAECYGDHDSERLVGQAIHHDRDRWIIATKFGHRFTSPFEREQAWSVAQVQLQMEESLAALDIDRIDLYQFHSGTKEAFDNDELWTMLARQKQAGKVRHLGISVASSISAADQVNQVRRAREVGAECVQVVYNRLQRAPEQEILPWCHRAGVGVLARVPLASGFLTGKYGAAASFAPDDIRSRKDPGDIKRMAGEAARILREEVPAGTQMAAWALAWCLRSPGVTAVIPGCKDPAQLAQNAAAADLLAESGSMGPGGGTGKHRGL
jgi:myo-inositol catabolism protein IolS